MQRQSLGGSPVTKLHIHGGAAVAVAREDAPSAASSASPAEESKRRDSFSASLSLLLSDEDRKTAKLHRLSASPLSPTSKPEKFVHLIPLLTVLCFLILYLCSHSPSQTDLAEFNGFNRSPKRIDESAEAIDDINGLSDLQKSNVIAVRSLRNLQEINKRRSGRKLGDF